jgi:hypothetical protein
VGYDFGHNDKKMDKETKIIFTTEKTFLDKLTEVLKKKEKD